MRRKPRRNKLMWRQCEANIWWHQGEGNRWWRQREANRWWCQREYIGGIKSVDGAKEKILVASKVLMTPREVIDGVKSVGEFIIYNFLYNGRCWIFIFYRRNKLLKCNVYSSIQIKFKVLQKENFIVYNFLSNERHQILIFCSQNRSGSWRCQRLVSCTSPYFKHNVLL